jgi:hypothetical protein
MMARNDISNGAAPTTDAQMKIAMAGVALTICEAARFKEASDLLQVGLGWASGTFIKHPDRFVYWSCISCALARG